MDLRGKPNLSELRQSPEVITLAQAATATAQREMIRQTQRNRLGWYLTSPVGGQSDSKAIEALKLRRYEVYYPLIREKRVLPKRELTVRQRRAGIEIIAVRDRPYLPRYVFVRMDPHAGDWEIISRECGIAGLACRDRMPVRFREELIVTMRGKEVGGAIPGALPALTVFEVGETVKINHGPFASYRGIVEKLRTRTIADIDIITGLTVAIDIFGRPTPVDLEVDHVEKLASGDHG